MAFCASVVAGQRFQALIAAGVCQLGEGVQEGICFQVYSLAGDTCRLLKNLQDHASSIAILPA